MAKKRAAAIREFYIGIGCLGKNILMSLTGILRVILFKSRASYSLSVRIYRNKIERQCFAVEVFKKYFFKTKSGNVFVFDQNGVKAAGRYSRVTYTFLQILMGFKAYYVDVRDGSVRH
ncbi:hypothetical protein N8089_00265 [Flavobacteriales bacterium]|nr:hypothetical protein [Flavobacteriales bacterium]